MLLLGQTHIEILLILTAIGIAYTNGANSNFKGVATLFGNSTTSYEIALRVGTISTLAGGLCSIFFAKGLIKSFSGYGIVPYHVLESPKFLLSVGISTMLTVFISTRLGLPVSTTHSLLGGLSGAGFVAAGSQLCIGGLMESFVAPLVISPILSVGLVVFFLYLQNSQLTPVKVVVENLSSGIGNAPFRRDLSNTSNFLITLHFISAVTVSFARGLNDTPKIVAILLAARPFRLSFAVTIISVAMALGGVINARRVAITMAEKIAKIDDAHGLTANISTSFLVIGASWFNIPMSTTHVSVGSIIGVGIVNRSTNIQTIRTIMTSWLFTLPVAAFLSGVIWLIVV